MFASLVLLMAAARKKEKRLKCGASGRHITNLKQSIFSFDKYDDLAHLAKDRSRSRETCTTK